MALVSIIVLLVIFLLLTLYADEDVSAPFSPMVPYRFMHGFNGNVSNGNAVTGTVHELSMLLDKVAGDSKNSSIGKFVITIAVNYAFRKLALNFVCNLKRLNLQNYVILSMDKAVYEYLAVRGANVFFYEETVQRRRLHSLPSHSVLNSSAEVENVFGSSAFVETSRRKSILVLKVLRLGYSVLFSDVDVVWIRDPIPEVVRYDYDFVIQSDRKHADQDMALNYNVNSGFYLVRSTKRSVTALQAIVKYSTAIQRSEQKAFNYVLCGAFKDHHMGPGVRIGSNECLYQKVGATAKMLPLDQFPNGSDESLWMNNSAPFVDAYPNVIAVHANYIQGLAHKVDRIQNIGYWMQSDEQGRADECIVQSSR